METFWIPRAHLRNSVGSRKRLQPADEVYVDDQTFRDLEVFQGQDTGPSLFDVFNRTRTSGGAKALHSRWQRPLATAGRIRGVQESLRHIVDNMDAFKPLPADGAVTAVEHYLYSGMAVFTSGSSIDLMLQIVQTRMDDFRRYWRMLTGVQRTAQLIRSLQRLVSDPRLHNAPGELGEHMARLAQLLDRPGFSDLPDEAETELPFWRVGPLDRTLRHDERATIEQLLKIVFEIDALVSMGSAMREYQLTLPVVEDGVTRIDAVDVYHPFLKQPIANPLQLDQTKRLLFVTGPNMAGKTTYLRACGVAIYLAHLGMGVPARTFRFSPCNCMYSAISLSDNIRAGISFFQAEALRLKSIAQALADGRRVVALLDEPFMGTNVKDALDASLFVLTRLAAKHNSVFIVSSHLMELGKELTATNNVACWHFEAEELPQGLVFDYRVRPGVSTQRLGVRVLREQGVFSLLEAEPEIAVTLE